MSYNSDQHACLGCYTWSTSGVYSCYTWNFESNHLFGPWECVVLFFMLRGYFMWVNTCYLYKQKFKRVKVCIKQKETTAILRLWYKIKILACESRW